MFFSIFSTAKRALSHLCLASLLIAVSSFQSARAANLVIDGGFESATASSGDSCYAAGIDGNWSATQGTIAIAVSGEGGLGVPHSGAHFTYLGCGTSVNTISQTLTTVPGQSYVLSYWLADTQPNPVTVNFGSQSIFAGFAPTSGVGVSGDYVNYTFTVTATSTSTVLSFTGQWLGGEGNIGTQLDDVSVTPTTPSQTATAPMTPMALLMLAGLVGLVGLVRYRRRHAWQKR